MSVVFTPSHFLGIDWSTTVHTACLLDATGQRRHNLHFAHSPQGIDSFLDSLGKQVADLKTVAFGLETSTHPLVDELLRRQLSVYAINPKQSDRFRDRHTAAGSKDDTKDPFVIADALRTDLHKFQKLTVPSPALIAIREASRRRHELVGDLRRVANRLWSQLDSFAPSLLSLCSGADKPFFWDLLELGLDYQQALRLKPKDVQAVLTRRRIRSKQADAVLVLLREPRFDLLAGRAEATLRRVGVLLPQLRLIDQQLREALTDLAALVPQAGMDAKIIDSMVGVDIITTATFLSEATQSIIDRNLSALRAQAGTAPVSRQSGGSRRVSMRHACNPLLRDACFHMARTAVTRDPWAKQLYQQMRARGLGYQRALRGVADRLLKRLIACLEAQKPYDPTRYKS